MVLSMIVWRSRTEYGRGRRGFCLEVMDMGCAISDFSRVDLVDGAAPKNASIVRREDRRHVCIIQSEWELHWLLMRAFS